MVLDGAKALAIPTKYGQALEIKPSEKKGLQWESLDENGTIWYTDFFDLKNLNPSSPENRFSSTLSLILKEARKLNREFLSDLDRIQVETKLDFPRIWGLGTSSTLINNIAQWAKVDAFTLLSNSFGGSGYDIAAAQNNLPILFRLKDGNPIFEQLHLSWNFKDSLFFVHLNQKQDSKQGISHYRKHQNSLESLDEISQISDQILDCGSLSDFEALLVRHETIISKIIQLPTIKEQLFQDYPRTIKSLGAWGGDFVLATGTEAEMEYFIRRGYSTIIPFSEMIR